MNLFKKKKLKKHRRISRREILKRKALIRLGKLNLRKKNCEDMLSKILRDFFSDALKIRYEFTYEELIRELKNKKIGKNRKNQIVTILEELNNIEFTKNRLSAKDIRLFKDRISQLIRFF